MSEAQQTTTPHKITSKIIGHKVLDKEAIAEVAETSSEFETMHEGVQRPDMLLGASYKIKPAGQKHALYITINDVILNQGTENEIRHPYEIFINCKNMDNFQWVVAMTRLMSAVFRKGGDVTFIIDEMKGVFDPQGGYFKKGIFMPSIVAEIGHVIEDHLKFIGLLEVEELDEHQKQLIEEKRKEFEDRHGDAVLDDGYPEKAVPCKKCNARAMVVMDNCLTCLECGESKCG